MYFPTPIKWIIPIATLLLFFSCEKDSENNDNKDNSNNNTSLILSPTTSTDCNTLDSTITTISEAEINASIQRDNKAISDEIIKLINEHRKGLNLQELSNNNLAKHLATQHNDNQIKEAKISHDNAQLRACTIFKLESATSYGENVASGFTTAKAIVDGWIGSKDHRENIEKANFNQSGVATTADKDGKLYFTHILLTK